MKTRQQYETALLTQFKIREQADGTILCELCEGPAKIRYHYFKPTGGSVKKPTFKHYWICEVCKERHHVGEHNDE